MVGITNSSGIGKIYAVIGVTYPSGSTCTCTNGSKTLTAKNTSGKAIFVIPSAGTWTVKAVSGSKSTSKTVSITAEGQVETVVLAYELVLFDNGDVTSLTGGWKATYSFEDYGSAKIADGLITIQGAVAYGGASSGYQTLYMTKNKINFTPYKAFKAHINTVSTNAALLVKTQQTLDGWWDEPLTANTCGGYKKLTTSDAGANASVDISSLTGSYYVGFLVDGQGKIVTPKVWLE